MSHDIEILEKLGEDVAAALGSGPSEERCILQRRDFLATVTDTRSPRRGYFVAAAGIAAAAVLTLFLFDHTPKSTALLPFHVGSAEIAGTQGQWIRTKAVGLPIRFEDGSNFELSANTSARMVRSDKEEVRLDLADGKVLCNVNKETGAKWMVSAGPYTISVTGTVFDAEWEGSDGVLAVNVVRGSVLVTGADLSEHGVRLAKGDRLRVDADRAVISQGSESEELDLDETLDDAELDTEPPEASITAPMQKSRSVRKNGRARISVSEDGLSLKDLWKAANKARYSRDFETAESMLTTLRRRYPNSREADASLFLMGRIRLELQGDAIGAVKWFKQYLRNTPNGPLAEESLGRVVDAYKRANKKEKAKQYAKKYLSRYSDGLFADQAHSVLNH